MGKKELSNKVIIEALKGKANALQSKIDALDEEIDNLNEELERIEDAISVLEPRKKVVKVKGHAPKVTVTPIRTTVAERVEASMKAYNIPMTSSELLEAINKDGGKVLAFQPFSGQWSIIYRDPKKPFKRIEFPENPNDSRFFYGLKEWFYDENLKPNYLEKLIRAKKIKAEPNLFGA